MKIKSIEFLEGNFEVECLSPGSSKEVYGLKLKNTKESSYPDIDYDVSNNEKVRGHIINKWGEDNVAYISNWNSLQLRSLLKDLSKFYDIPFYEVNAVSNIMLIEATPKIKEARGIKAGILDPPATFEEVMEHSESLIRFLEKYPQVSEHVKNLVRQIRSASTHAGGIIISQNLPERMPLIRSKGKNQSPWSEGQNVRHLEPLGFLKFDILGLGTLEMFEDAIKFILKRHEKIENPTFEQVKQWYDQHLHPDRINFDDQKVYEFVFREGNFLGVFQFAERGMQHFAKQVCPTSLDEVSAVSAIFRPGPLSSGVDKDFVKAKRNPKSIHYIHPIVEEVLGKNFGFIIYQEDLAWLAHKLGSNVSLEEGNLLRKVLTKKGTGKGHEVKDGIKQKFLLGCLEKGIQEKDAEELWQKMEYFSQYGFNRCLSKETFVNVKDVGKTRISDVKVGDEVNSVNGFVKVKNVFNNGKKPVYKIKTSSGKTLTCTLDHKLQTLDGMKTLREIINNNLKVLVLNA